MSGELITLTRKDFVSGQDVKWCPGCGNYAVLAQVQRVLPELGIPREDFAFISGIGCSSRFPYYMATYGMHSIHGRAPAIATGLKLARPELSVWVVTGDGDGLSIGGNHLIHAMRRNVDLKILMFNNRIYGLTKGQASPTSELGKETRSSPFGTVDRPFEPLALALGADATMVARVVDTDAPMMLDVLRRAARHRGTAFIEILQNCVVFNEGAFDELSDKAIRAEHQLALKHGAPLLFGSKERPRGVRLGPGLSLEVVDVGDGPGQVPAGACLTHDEAAASPALALLLSRLGHDGDGPEGAPTALGILRAVERPTLADRIAERARRIDGADEPPLEALFRAGDTWTVGEAAG